MNRNPLTRRLALVLAVAVMVAIAVLAAGCSQSSRTATTAGQTATTAKAATAASTATTATTVAAPEVADVNLMMDWSPWVLDIPIDVAQTMGFYERRGLSVHQTLPVGATDVVKFVSSGKSQFGLYYAPDMLMALEAGAPLVSIGSLMSHAPVGMAFRPGLTGDSPASLAGQTVSVPLIPSTRASFASMLSAAGVDPKTVNIVDPGFELVAPLLKGTIAAAAFTEFGELVAAEAQGQELSYLDFRDWGTPDFAFLNIITTQEFAKANPNTTRAFVQGTLEGLAYAVAHPEEAVALYVKAHPELDQTLLLAQWKAAIPSLALTADAPAGWQDIAAWESLNTWMTSAGLLARPADLVPAVTNDYLTTSK